jgi:hypothetical protein
MAVDFGMLLEPVGALKILIWLFSMIAMIVGAASKQLCPAEVFPVASPAATFTYMNVNGGFFMAIIVMSFIIQLVLLVLYVTSLERLGSFKISWWFIVR